MRKLIRWMLIVTIALTLIIYFFSFWSFVWILIKSLIHPALFESTPVAANPVIIAILISFSFLFRAAVLVLVVEVIIPLVLSVIFWSRYWLSVAGENFGHWFLKNNGHLQILALAVITLIPFAIYKIGSEPSFILNCFRSFYNDVEIIRQIVVILGTVLTFGIYDFPETYPIVATTSLQWFLALVLMPAIFVAYAPIAASDEIGEGIKKFIGLFSKKGQETIDQAQQTHATATAVAAAPGVSQQHGAAFFLGIALLGEYLWRAITKLFHLGPHKAP